MNEQDFKKLFETRRIDIPDDGFSERLAKRLPERRNMLPQIVMAVFSMAGIALAFAMQGVHPMLEQIDSLIASILQMQAPSPASVIAYFGALGMLGFIGYAAACADAG